jgi:hypothetical protein
MPPQADVVAADRSGEEKHRVTTGSAKRDHYVRISADSVQQYEWTFKTTASYSLSLPTRALGGEAVRIQQQLNKWQLPIFTPGLPSPSRNHGTGFELLIEPLKSDAPFKPLTRKILCDLK